MTDSENLARKRRIRGGHRGSATRSMNTVEALLAEEEPDPARLAQLKLSLEEKLSTLTRLDSEILDLTENEHLEGEILESDEFKDGVYRAIVQLDRAATSRAAAPIIVPTTVPVVPTTVPAVPTTVPTTVPAVPAVPTMVPAVSAAPTTTVTTDPPVSTALATGTSTTRTVTTGTTPISTPAVIPTLGVRLPKITMQPFDGDVTNWTSFWDSFDSAIHRNAGLNEIDKFNYLRSLLKGSARDANIWFDAHRSQLH